MKSSYIFCIVILFITFSQGISSPDLLGGLTNTAGNAAPKVPNVTEASTSGGIYTVGNLTASVDVTGLSQSVGVISNREAEGITGVTNAVLQELNLTKNSDVPKENSTSYLCFRNTLNSIQITNPELAGQTANSFKGPEQCLSLPTEPEIATCLKNLLETSEGEINIFAINAVDVSNVADYADLIKSGIVKCYSTG